MIPTLDQIRQKYSKEFEISEDKENIRIKSIKPILNHPDYGPSYLDYKIEKTETTPHYPLSQRTRTMRLHDKQGECFQGLTYHTGLGIWQVTKDKQILDVRDIGPEEIGVLRGWMAFCDQHVLNRIPELKEILETSKDK